MRHIGWIVVGIFLVFLAALYVDLPGTSSFAGHPVVVNKGIDIAGGARVLLCTPDKAPPPSSADMSTAQSVISSRVAGGYGVTEPQVNQVGNKCISVELPGLKGNTNAVVNAIGKTGYLALTDAGSAPGQPNVPPYPLATGTKVKLTCSGGQANGCPLGSKPGASNLTAKPPVLNVIAAGKYVSQGSAQVGFDSSTGSPQVTYTLTGAGNTAWCNYTTSHVSSTATSYYSAIVLDGKVVSDPTINSAICQGQTQITGITSTTEAKQLATYLNYGALPVSLHPTSSQVVAASLGSQYVNDAEKAGIIAMIIVALFMIVYYRLPGLLADLALVMYAIVVFALFKFIGVTLTLAGIAGFILSIGMAVDANVLIFERMKEELRSGKTLGAAVETGFKRAFPSIRDSNASTLITTVILFWFGHNFAASTITGFASTLFIGVVVSLLTAVFVSHTFLRLLVLSGYARKPSFYGVEQAPTGAPVV